MMLGLVLSALVAQQPALPIEVPFRIGEDAIIVDAVVNGHKASLMFDTGFSGTVILSDELNVGPATGTMALRDFVGQFEAKTVRVNSMKLGALNVAEQGMEIVQQPMSHMSSSYNTHTDGIMGLEAVKSYVVEINVERKCFIFHPKSTDISGRTPDNKKTFLGKMLPIGRNSIEMTVSAQTGGKLTLALDTGNAFFATTHRDVLERVGLWEQDKKPDFMRSAWVASGPVDSWDAQMSNMTIFGVPVTSSVWSLIDLPSSSAEGDGTVGFGFLRNFNITIDMERRRVWLDNWTGKVSKDPDADVGLSCAYDPIAKRVKVFRVTPGSPAEKAGIKKGDSVLGVDALELSNLGPRQLYNLMQGPPGSTIKLAISRDGNLTRHELVRALLVNVVKPGTSQ